MKFFGIGLLAIVLIGCGSESVEQPSAGLSSDDQRILAWSNQRDEKTTPSATKKHNAAPVSDLVAGLEARLESNPDDAGGWTLLAQSYAFTGRMLEAKDAGARAVALGANEEHIESLLLAAHTRTSGS